MVIHSGGWEEILDMIFQGEKFWVIFQIGTLNESFGIESRFQFGKF